MTPPSRRRIERTLFVAVLLVGWGLALARLGERSLWADEGATAYQAERTRSLATALELHKEYHFLHLVTTMAVVRLSRTEFFLRLPSAMAVVLALPALYVAGRRRLGRPTALTASSLLAISPFVLGYAQEARAYALLMMFACLSLLLLLLALARRHWAWWAGYAVGTTLLLYAHFFAWFVVAAEVVFALGVLLWQSARQRKLDLRLPWLGLSFLAVAALYLPLLGPLLEFVQRYAPATGSGQGGVLPHFDLSLTRVRSFAAIYGPKMFGWQEIPFALGFVLGSMGLVLRKKWHVLGLAGLWFAIPLAGLTVAAGSHFFDYRYLIFFVPIFLLVTAEGVAAVAGGLARVAGRPRGGRLHLLAAVGLAALVFVPANAAALRAHHNSEKENWRNIGAFVGDNVLPDEVIYVTPALWAKPLIFYQPGLEPRVVAASAYDVERLPQTAARHTGLWYVRYAGPLGDPTGALSAWIAEQDFELLIDGGACGWGIHVYYRRFDAGGAAREVELLREAAAFCPSDPRFAKDGGQAPPR